MASSELLPPAPLATACDADGVLGSPAKKRGEGSPEVQHASFYHVAIIQNAGEKGFYPDVVRSTLHQVDAPRGWRSEEGPAAPTKQKLRHLWLKASFFFDNCKINPITNNGNTQTCLFSLSVFPLFLSNLILQDSAFSADYLF